MNNLNIQIRQITNGYLILSYPDYEPAAETFCESLPDVFKKIEEEVALQKNKRAAETALAAAQVTSAGITQ